jgi:hypothetical protein
MRAILATLSMAAGMAWAQTSLTPPQVGFMRDAADSLRPVYGIAGNFLVGDPVAIGVISAAHSGSYGWVKTSSTVAVIDKAGAIVATSTVADGPALFAFTRTGEPALAYLPASNQLRTWKAGAFTAVSFDAAILAANSVLAVAAPDSGHAAMIVQRDDGLWDVRVQLATSEIDAQTALLGVAAPVLMFASGDLVYSDADGIVLRKPDGSERHIIARLPSSFAFQQMGIGWVQLQDLAGGQQFAFRIAQNREQSYQLPEVDQ